LPRIVAGPGHSRLGWAGSGDEGPASIRPTRGTEACDLPRSAQSRSGGTGSFRPSSFGPGDDPSRRTGRTTGPPPAGYRLDGRTGPGSAPGVTIPRQQPNALAERWSSTRPVALFIGGSRGSLRGRSGRREKPGLETEGDLPREKGRPLVHGAWRHGATPCLRRQEQRRSSALSRSRAGGQAGRRGGADRLGVREGRRAGVPTRRLHDLQFGPTAMCCTSRTWGGTPPGSTAYFRGPTTGSATRNRDRRARPPGATSVSIGGIFRCDPGPTAPTGKNWSQPGTRETKNVSGSGPGTSRSGLFTTDKTTHEQGQGRYVPGRAAVTFAPGRVLQLAPRRMDEPP